MISEEQTICVNCKAPYSEASPPRLLTMCGHTFCEKCIRDMMSKKKMNSKYRLTCPIDKMATELPNPNPSLFPKNLSVLNLVRKKEESTAANRKISGRSETTSWKANTSPLLVESEVVIQEKQVEEESKYKSKDQPKYDENSNTCLLHQKPLQLVCSRDFQKVCSSCVIFGEHRGHAVKSINETEQIVVELKEALILILEQSKSCFLKLESKDTSKAIDDMITKKKSDLTKEITKRFQKLKEQIIQTEKKTLLRLEQKVEDMREKIAKNLDEKKSVRRKYQDWEQTLKEKIKDLDEDDEQKLKTAFKCENFLEVSQRNLENFKYLAADYLSESEKQLENLALHYDDDEVNRLLQSYCKFEDCNNSFLQIHTSRVSNLNHIMHEEILLDDIEEPITSVIIGSPSRNSSQKTCENKIQKSVSSNLRLSIVAPHQSTSSKLNRLKSIGRETMKENRFFTSPSTKNADLKSSRLMSSQRSMLHSMMRAKEIPDKYEQKIQGILSGTSDTLDLTNGQLSNQRVTSILEYIKDRPVTIVKLVRNKITDEGLTRFIGYINDVVMLNVSRNDLTEKSMEYLLRLRKQGGLKSLKSLMIGQNKIVERKNKDMLDQFRKMGVNICN